MTVDAVCFGVLKERLGWQRQAVTLADAASVREFLRAVGADGDALRGIAVAVNDVYAQSETILREGDEVALLPPVSGGR